MGKAALLLLVALAAALDAAPLQQDWRIEPFEWRGSLGGARVLTVRNPYGDVRARRSEGDEVSVHAALQRHREDPREWTIAIEERGGGFAVEVQLADGKVPEAAAADWGLRRVDLTVYLPARAKLEVETVSGLIEAKRLGGDVEARSAGGEIVIIAAGSVDARSDSGPIRSAFLDPAWAGSARLATRGGAITVHLLESSDIDLTIRTRGEIASDVALAPSGGADPGTPRRAPGSPGGGRVAIESETGNVNVQRIPS